MTPRPEAIALEMDTDDEISSESEQEMEVASESSLEDEMEDIPAIKSIEKDSNSQGRDSNLSTMAKTKT